MYPVLKEGVTIGTFRYEGSKEIHYYSENPDGEEFELSRRLWNALLQADGTHPLDLPDRGQSILPKLKKCGLVRTSRFVREDGALNRFILFPFGDKKRNGNLTLRAINAALPVVSILIFALGVFLMISRRSDTAYSINWWLYYGSLVVSTILHEAGHLIADLAYGYKISDTGILLLGIIPIGAYVAHEKKKDSTKAEEIQLSLSGIEVNLLIAGICLFAAMWYYPLSFTMILVANMNVALAGINLLPASGLDGEAALSAACGINNISEVAKKWFSSKKRRQKLIKSGFLGHVCIFLFAITLLSKALLWLIIGFNVVSFFFNAL